MAKYTIEDVEILRQKSGLSYDEAVNLLEYHNGSLAQALMDLEKNGRIRTGTHPRAAHKGFKGVVHYLYCLRMIVQKDQITIANLSVLFLLILLLIECHGILIAFVIALVLGYRIRFEAKSPDFLDVDLGKTIKNAKKNVQDSVSSFARQFTRDEKTQPDAEEVEQESEPAGTRPVNVQFPDGGTVDVRDGGDGYHEADIQ